MTGVVDCPIETSTPERELGVFLLLTLGISWGLGLGGSVLVGPAAYLVGVFGPALAALWVTRQHEGHTRTIWTHVLRWRISPKWYLAALAVPLALIGAAFAIVSVGGGAWDLEDPLPLLAAPLFLIFLLLIGGGPEELGWRGYALPRLQSRWDALTASLVLGLVWAVWHAPLWFMSELAFAELNFPLYATQILAMCVVYTWLYNSTQGSVLLAALLHASTNLASNYLAPSLQPQIVLTALWVVVAAFLVARYGRRDLARSDRVDRDKVRNLAAVAAR